MRFLYYFLLLFSSLFAKKVFIKGGEYILPPLKEYSISRRIIKINSFYIDDKELSYKQFPSLKDPYNADDEPIVNISYKQALNLCKNLGGDLPTEDEWIVAAGFKNNKFFKYGGVNIEKLADSIINVNYTIQNINGLYGIIGNVWEIVKSKGDFVILKGGSNLLKINYDIRIRNEVLKKNLKRYNHVGVRCVYRDK